LMRIMGSARKGSIREVSEVRNLIENIIYSEMHDKLLGEILDSLKEIYKPGVDSIVWDSLLHQN